MYPEAQQINKGLNKWLFKALFLSSIVCVVVLNSRSLFKPALYDYVRLIGIDPENEPELILENKAWKYE